MSPLWSRRCSFLLLSPSIPVFPVCGLAWKEFSELLAFLFIAGMCNCNNQHNTPQTYSDCLKDLKFISLEIYVRLVKSEVHYLHSMSHERVSSLALYSLDEKIRKTHLLTL